MKTETELINDWLERNEIIKIPTTKKTYNQKIKIRKKLRSKKGFKKKGSRK